MRTLTTLGLIGALAAAANGQNVRAPQNLSNDASLAVFDGIPASSGDSSVVLYVNSSNELTCFHSDGRGIDWTGPVRVDADVSGGRKDLDHPSVVMYGSGTNVYCVWEDRRLDGSTEQLYFNRSSDGGATWGTELLIYAGDITGDNARMSVVPGSPDIIHVVCLDSVGDDTMHLLTSTDGGASFSDTVVAGATSDIDYFDLRASGSTVHIAYDDNVGGADDVYYLRSSDDGATFDVGPVVVDVNGVGAGNSGLGIGLAVAGSVVAISFIDDNVEESLYVNTSTDGGATFNGSVLVGDYTADTHDVDNPVIMATGSNLVIAWEDNRNGGDEVFVATSTDSGATWTETAALGAGGFPRVSNLSGAAQQGCGIAFTGGSFPEDNLGAISNDNGASFTAVSFDAPAGDTDFAEITYNEFYGNFITTHLHDADTHNDVFVGGVRPQTLTPVGWVPGPTVGSFDLSGFAPGVAQGWVIGALNTGNLPLPDGRNSGIGFDFWTKVTINLAVAGAYSADLTDGAGSTPGLSMNFTGFDFAFFGIGITGLTVGELTDVVEIDL